MRRISAPSSKTKPTAQAVYTLRVDRGRLDRLSLIAAAEHRTLAQKLRVMIDHEVALHDKPTERAA